MHSVDYIEFYDFGDFRFGVRNRLLRRGERQINLALKEFEVLFFLIENAGRVVEKTELHEAVWKNTFIEEGTLTKNISLTPSSFTILPPGKSNRQREKSRFPNKC